ncbi:hypothetical protein HaLaN_10108 [Haematococcus lacustris]|uniref:Uncharacterized protein n=1 Tax=Haematococcus lacustris TaxID=44745 RepID=A0A699YY31_HAELA|nr:hypothetical protein HaLaN_10108 [Haematococcus lacustris]
MRRRAPTAVSCEQPLLCIATGTAGRCVQSAVRKETQRGFSLCKPSFVPSTNTCKTHDATVRPCDVPGLRPELTKRDADLRLILHVCGQLSPVCCGCQVKAETVGEQFQQQPALRHNTLERGVQLAGSNALPEVRVPSLAASS